MDKIFIPAYLKKDPLPSVEKALKRLRGYKRIGLIATAQHLNQLDGIRRFLSANGKISVEGGQILGCNLENARRIAENVDCFLYIGSGRFHPLKVSVSTDKPVVTANPYSNSSNVISQEDKRRYIKRRKGRLMKALEAEIFGILISTKEGQFNMEKAVETQKRIRDKGKKALLFAGSEITPENLLPFKVDAWVNTACPRLADDFFDKPLLKPEELEILYEM
jgi:2-(3-amino-3-carboxypropyl)histidine synthase